MYKLLVSEDKITILSHIAAHSVFKRCPQPFSSAVHELTNENVPFADGMQEKFWQLW